VRIEVVYGEEPEDAHQELVEDLIAIVTSFAGELYSVRSCRKEKLVVRFIKLLEELRRMLRVVRTVVVPSVVLSKRKFDVLRELEEMYRRIVAELVEFGFVNNVKSFTGLKKYKYRELRSRYPHLPSHYVHVACQDASTRIASFLKLRKKELVKTNRPKINKVSIWLDDHLWKLLGYTAIKVATHRGWIVIELQPHKLFWKYINSGWKLRAQPKLRLDHRERRVYVYFVFEKEVDTTVKNCGSIISVDVNESNVTVKVLNRVYILETDIKKLILGYASYREVMQSIKSCGHVKRAVHGRERNRKNDRRRKIANIIASTAKQLNATVVLEDLPKQCPKNMINNVRSKELRHRVYQAGFRSIIKIIEEKCIEKGVHVVKVDPKNTSSVCPFCGSKLMRGNAPRRLKCPKCGIEMDRDVAAVLNLEKRYLTSEGCVPFTPMPDDSALEVAVLPMKEWMRRKSLEATPSNPKVHGRTL